MYSTSSSNRQVKRVDLPNEHNIFLLLGLEHAKNTSPSSQTHTQRRETKIYEVRQDAYVPGAAYVPGTEERDLLMIYIRYKRITTCPLKNSHQKPLTLNILTFYSGI